VRSRPGAARTILLSHIISARPSKQPLMVRNFLKEGMELGFYFLFLQEQIKDIIIFYHHPRRHLSSGGDTECAKQWGKTTSPRDGSSASGSSELSTVISLPSPFAELEFTETSALEAETESYPEREMYESGSSSMSSDGSPMTSEEAMRAAGVDSCYNVASSDGSFALQNAGYVSSSSELCSREGSRADSLPQPESTGRLLAEPYFVFGGGAQQAVQVHGDTGIDMLQPRKFDEHVYNAVPRAERGHDVAAPPPTSLDDIDIVAGGMGALALSIQYSVIVVRGNGVIHRGQKPASRG